MPARKYSNEPLVLIATSPNEPIGMMWAEALENEGIHCLTKSADFLRVTQYIPAIMSPLEIYVLASQAEKAKEILAPFLEAEAAGDFEELDESEAEEGD